MTLERISIDPAVMNGQPCIRGTRLTVRRVLYILAETNDREELRRDYPRLDDLLDEGLPVRAAVLLREDGIDAVHVTEVEALSTPDETVLELGRTTARVVVTLDADFHALLAASRPGGRRYEAAASVVSP